jgi:hypothetical protein
MLAKLKGTAEYSVGHDLTPRDSLGRRHVDVARAPRELPRFAEAVACQPIS